MLSELYPCGCTCRSGCGNSQQVDVDSSDEPGEGAGNAGDVHGDGNAGPFSGTSFVLLSLAGVPAFLVVHPACNVRVAALGQRPGAELSHRVGDLLTGDRHEPYVARALYHVLDSLYELGVDIG